MVSSGMDRPRLMKFKKYVTFINLDFLGVFRLHLAGILSLRTRPLNLLIKFCLDSFRPFVTISLDSSELVGLFSAMSDKMSPPVLKVSLPRALTRLQTMG
jgi:hypothetical protein